MSNPPSWFPGSSAGSTLTPRLSLPTSRSPKVPRLHGRPSPHHCAVREMPISRPVFGGRKLPRIPNSLASLIVRVSSSSVMKLVSVHGPIQLNHFDLNAVLEFRWMEIPGDGRALVDKIKLPSRPGPHQRSCQPAEIIQFPSAIPT